VQRPSLRRLLAAALTGNSVYALCQWGVLIAIAKLGTSADVGLYSLALAVTAPIFMLSALQLRSLLATERGDQYVFGDYLALRIVATAVSLLAVAVLLVSGAHDQEARLVIWVVAMVKAVEALGDIFQGYTQARERLDLVGRSLALKGVLAVAGMAIGLTARGQLLDGIAGVLLAWTIGLLLFDVRFARLARNRGAAGDSDASGLRPRWSRRRLVALGVLGAPLGLASGLTSLSINLPRLVVESKLGLESLGVYSALAYLMVGGQIVGSSVAYALSARLAALFVTDRLAYRRLLLGGLAACCAVGLVGVAIAVCCGSQVLTMLYTPEYSLHKGAFVAVMVATMLNMLFWPLGIALTIARRTAEQMWIRALCVLVAWGTVVWLTPRMGILGAAMALCFAFGAQFVAGLLMSRDHLRIVGDTPTPGAREA